MKLSLPRVVCPHSTSAATTSRPKPWRWALSLSQRPTSGETESAPSNEAMPKHSLLLRRRMTKEKLFGSGACALFSHRVTYSIHDGGSHGMNLAMAGVMHPKTSCASVIWNWLSCNLGDWMTIIVPAYQIAGNASFNESSPPTSNRWPSHRFVNIAATCHRARPKGRPARVQEVYRVCRFGGFARWPDQGNQSLRDPLCMRKNKCRIQKATIRTRQTLGVALPSR